MLSTQKCLEISSEKIAATLKEQGMIMVTAVKWSKCRPGIAIKRRSSYSTCECRSSSSCCLSLSSANYTAVLSS